MVSVFPVMSSVKRVSLRLELQILNVTEQIQHLTTLVFTQNDSVSFAITPLQDCCAGIPDIRSCSYKPNKNTTPATRLGYSHSLFSCLRCS